MSGLVEFVLHRFEFNLCLLQPLHNLCDLDQAFSIPLGMVLRKGFQSLLRPLRFLAKFRLGEFRLLFRLVQFFDVSGDGFILEVTLAPHLFQFCFQLLGFGRVGCLPCLSFVKGKLFLQHLDILRSPLTLLGDRGDGLLLGIEHPDGLEQPCFRLVRIVLEVVDLRRECRVLVSKFFGLDFQFMYLVLSLPDPVYYLSLFLGHFLLNAFEAVLPSLQHAHLLLQLSTQFGQLLFLPFD